MSDTDRPFALLIGYTYYPAPGWQGYVGDFSTLEEATAEGRRRLEDYDWWQVVDIRSKSIVGGEGEGHTGLFGKFPANPNAAE